MRRLFATALLLAAAGSLSAQQPESLVDVNQNQVLTPTTVTPEIWLYSQEQRRHDDPQQAVRRKAEFKAEQRLHRMATMKWFGMSNQRPQASTVPMMGVYSPSWTGNGQDRYDWAAIGYPATTLRVEHEYIVPR